MPCKLEIHAACWLSADVREVIYTKEGFFKMVRNLLFTILLSLIFTNCAGMIQDKNVTLINYEGDQYSGIIKYKDGYSGVLAIPNGPNGESFSGNFVVVDQTSINRKQGSIVIPQSNQIPAVGGVTQSSSGIIFSGR